MGFRKYAFFLSVSLACCQTVVADDLTIPNTFQPNTPARAADVNANFSAVEASVDDNAADIAANTSSIAAHETAIQQNANDIAVLDSGAGISVYANGIRLGRFFSFIGNAAMLLSDKGFLFSVGTMEMNQAGDYLQIARPVFYADVNCQGRVFVDGDSRPPLTAGHVFKVEGALPPFAYFTPRGIANWSDNLPVQSRAANGECINVTETRNFMFEVFPNDEAITGVSETPPVGTLVFGLSN